MFVSKSPSTSLVNLEGYLLATNNTAMKPVTTVAEPERHQSVPEPESRQEIKKRKKGWANEGAERTLANVEFSHYKNTFKFSTILTQTKVPQNRKV